MSASQNEAMGNADGSTSGVGGMGGAVDNQTLVQDFGRGITRNLGSIINKTVFPSRVAWALPTYELNDISQEQTSEMLGDMANLQKRMMSRFERMTGKSTAGNAVLHALVASCAVVHWKREDDKGPDRTRLFPLRQFVTEYQDSTLQRLIVCEETPRLGMAGNQIQGPRIYTEIVYHGKNSGVRQYNSKTAETREINDDSPALWTLVSNERPWAGRHYPQAFISHHIETIEYLNELYHSFRSLTREAARNTRIVRPGSGLKPHAVAKWSGSQVIEGRPGDVEYLSAGIKLNDHAAIQQVILRIEEGLKQDFLHRLLQNPGRMETATEVREVVAEMAAIDDHLYGHHSDFTQPQFARALLEMENITLEGPNGRIEPKILTGVSALVQQEAAETLFRIYTSIVQVYPAFATQIPVGMLFKRMADANQIETGDLLTNEMEFRDIANMLMTKVKEDPVAILPQLIQMLQGILPEGAINNDVIQQAMQGLATGLQDTQTQQ